MQGVILAGGTGSRLYPLTATTNKHLLNVYDQPMIYRAIKTLRDMGRTEIIIISGGEHIGGFAEILKDGSDFGAKFTYRVQPEAGGIAQALDCVKGLVDGLFPVILGDNYFAESPIMPKTPMIYLKEIENPARFGVYDPKTNQITEKPKKFISRQAVIGLYVYDERVFDLIKTLKPSQRGELEITDVNNWYLLNGAKTKKYTKFWSDMGTFNSLNDTANYIHDHSPSSN